MKGAYGLIYQYLSLTTFTGKKTNRGPVAQCLLILSWAHKTKSLRTQLAPEKRIVCKSMMSYRALDHPILGLIPNAKKYVFSKFRTKNSQFDKFFLFFFLWGRGFSIIISSNINTEHIVTYLQFNRIIECNNTWFFLSLFS